MNKIKICKTILLFFILSALVSCIEKKYIDETSIRIVSAIDRPDLRISGNNFEQNDSIGLYIVPYEANNTAPGILGQTNYANNELHIHQGTAWVTEQGVYLPWPGVRNIDAYAYHPYDANLSDPRNYYFSVLQNQTVPENYCKSDFLYARALAVPPSISVPLLFMHRMSKINVNVRSDLTPVKEAMELTGVHLQNIIPGCTIDLVDGVAVVDANGTPSEISIYTLPTPIANFDLSLTAVIPPQTVAQNTELIRINNRGINYFYITEAPVTFEQGYTTTFNIDITQQGIIVTTSILEEWEDGGTVSGNIPEVAPRVLDLNDIDWNESYIYHIYDGNTLIGQVCREYIYRTTAPAVDLPVVVVYPLGADGVMDLTRGLAARVYNRNRNASNQYEYNTGNVHGGSVVFGNANNLVSYTAGNLPLVNKVRIESAENITPVADNAITTLTLRPYKLTDIDNNQYAVTKIATQYWMRENFKAERYNDGTPLEHYYYNNNPDMYKDVFGALYTWYAATDPAGIAPDGWRVPTRQDWNNIYQYVNPQTGRKMKALYMWPTIANADDVTGFGGLPGGRRTVAGDFSEMNTYGQWWSSTSEGTGVNAWRYYLSDGTAIGEGTLNKGYAESVRLVRDNTFVTR